MDCCSTYSRVFNEKVAKKDTKRYLKKGLRNESKILYNALKSRVPNLSVTEIGCGIGSLSIELVKAGAASTIGIDISEEYIKKANQLKENLGFEK